MIQNIDSTVQIVKEIKADHDARFTGAKRWENTYISKQYERRQRMADSNDNAFSLEDHIRGMVYAMLTDGIPWSRIDQYVDLKTGTFPRIDDLFCGYQAEKIFKLDSEKLKSDIMSIGIAGQVDRKQQINALKENIRKLQLLDRNYGIDRYYEKFKTEDRLYHYLILQLSSEASQNKLKGLGVALAAEYLRNVGYDVAKPDRHLCNILGSERLACSDWMVVSPLEAIEIVDRLSKKMGMPATEIDYYLWAYCAKGYGEICTKNPKCSECRLSVNCEKRMKHTKTVP